MKNQVKRSKLAGLTAVAIMAAAAVVRADDAQLQDKIKQLEQRVTELEGKGTQDVYVAKSTIPQETLDFLGQVKITGFAEASYMYDFDAGGGSPVGRTYDTYHNQFDADMFKLTLEKPVDYSPSNWVAGFRADLIFGEDAAAIHSGNPAGSGNFNLGKYGDLEQAFIDVNIPVGNGLKVFAGKMVTLMGVEVVEQPSNPNFSLGNQFLFVENVTQTGIQLAYKWNDKVDTEFMVFNGWDVLPDNNDALSYMARIGYAACDSTSLAFLGYGGPEQNGNSSHWRDGAEVILTEKCTSNLTTYAQFDYGHEGDAIVTNGVSGVGSAGGIKKNADWYALGLWAVYDFTDKVELAVRGDYLKDHSGARTDSTFGFTPTGNNGPELYSLTFTLNYKPIANLIIRPELRWDHSDKPVYNGIKDQCTAGLSAAYLY